MMTDETQNFGIILKFFNLYVMGGVIEPSELFSKTKPQSKFTIKKILKNVLCFDLLSFTWGDRLNI